MGKKTVCIVGLSPTREAVANEPEGVEIWSLNQGHELFPPEIMARMTRWFQVHPWQEMVSRQDPALHHIEWLSKAEIPVYLEELRPDDVPAGVRYPFEDIERELGSRYMTSAIAFMFALAIYEGFELVKFYGLEMAHGTEYFDQRPCLEWWGGIAHARGIEVWAPEVCPLFTGERYAKSVMIPSATISAQMGELVYKKMLKKDEVNGAIGKLEMLRGLLQVEYPKDVHDDLGARFEDALTEHKSLLAEYHGLVGAVNICEQLVRQALKAQPIDTNAVANAARKDGNGYHPELLEAVNV